MLTTGVQLALLAGVLFSTGVVLVVTWLVPAHPDVLDVARRYSPEAAKLRASTPAPQDSTDRAGIWAIRRLPSVWWGRTPIRELALLQIPVHRHYGKKVVSAVTGLVLPPVVSILLLIFGYDIPFVVPVFGSILLAVALFFGPDFDVQRAARTARADFNRDLAAYTELVAMERMSGAGPRQSMEMAAEIGTSWVFRRLSEELRLSRFNGKTPWDSLQDLAEELGLPELVDLANVMRTSETGAQVYQSLVESAGDLNSKILSEEHARANGTTTSMNVPIAMLSLVFLCIIGTPALIQLTSGG
jgi:hypothetical protein